jgi:hypothetical protein
VKVDDDYAEYLGPGYLPPKDYSTVISNHSTAVDHALMTYFEKIKIVSKGAIRSVPIIGRLAEL